MLLNTATKNTVFGAQFGVHLWCPRISVKFIWICKFIQSALIILTELLSIAKISYHGTKSSSVRKIIRKDSGSNIMNLIEINRIC